MWIDLVLAVFILYLYLRLKRMDTSSVTNTTVTVANNGKDAARDAIDKHVREYHQ